MIAPMSQLLPGVKREDLAAPTDPDEGLRIAGMAAAILRAAYDDRLHNVVLFGSWARSQAHEESDVDLLVVLDDVSDRERETDRIVDLLFDLEADERRAIQAFPIAEREFARNHGSFPAVALDEGIAVVRSLQ